MLLSSQAQHTFVLSFNLLVSVFCKEKFAMSLARCLRNLEKGRFSSLRAELGFLSGFNGKLSRFSFFPFEDGHRCTHEPFPNIVDFHSDVTQLPYQVIFQCFGVCNFICGRKELLVFTKSLDIVSSHELTQRSIHTFLFVLSTASQICFWYFFSTASNLAQISKTFFTFCLCDLAICKLSVSFQTFSDVLQIIEGMKTNKTRENCSFFVLLKLGKSYHGFSGTAVRKQKDFHSRSTSTRQRSLDTTVKRWLKLFKNQPVNEIWMQMQQSKKIGGSLK